MSTRGPVTTVRSLESVAQALRSHRWLVTATLCLGCKSHAPPTPDPRAARGVVPDAMLGVWSREWIERRGVRSSPTTVRYLQTPTMFGDVRIPTSRPAMSGATSFADVPDSVLLLLAHQSGFVGVTTVTGDQATWHHDIDFQPSDSNPDIGRLAFGSPGEMFEHALDSSYTEFWWSLSRGDGRFLAIRVLRGTRLDRILLVFGDYFYYARNRRVDVPAAESFDALIRATHPSRAQLIEYLDCELSVGLVRGGTIPWQVFHSTLPWRQGKHLEFTDRVTAHGPGNGLSPQAAEGERWEVAVNTLDPTLAAVIFPPH